MIPRYAPTYRYSELVAGLSNGTKPAAEEQLRARFADLFKVKHVFLFDSARVALYALLKAYNRPGGVLMPAYNCIVVPEAVCYAGYSPVFADIEYKSLSMTADVVKRAISPSITVIFATHLFGVPCQIEEIVQVARQNNILVVEDAAPALGAEFNGQLIGSFGDAAVISFQSMKVVAGEGGGALLTNNDRIADAVNKLLPSVAPLVANWILCGKAVARKTAMHAWVYPFVQFAYRIMKDEAMVEFVAPHTDMPQQYLASCPQFSSRLVLMQLDRLNQNLERRRKIAQIYTEELPVASWLMRQDIPQGCSPAWIQYSIMVEDKNSFYKYMQHNRVDLSWTYRYSCADSFHMSGFPNSQKAAQTVLGLPTYPSLADEQARYICELARKYHPLHQ